MLYVIVAVVLLCALQGYAGSVSTDESIPVVYVLLGPQAPRPWLFLTFELSARNNDVIILTDLNLNLTQYQSPRIKYESASPFMSQAMEIKKYYVHIMNDNSVGRQHYEQLCMIRWFVALAYMKQSGLNKIFFGDGDTAVFANIPTIAKQWDECDAMLMITHSSETLGGRVSGHSSIWTLDALSDFTQFLMHIYQNRTGKYKSIFDDHRAHRKNISDMTLLWIWVVYHYSSAHWDLCFPPNSTLPTSNSNYHDAGFDYIKPKVGSAPNPLTLCNGLTPRHGRVFDHMWAWCGGKLQMNFATAQPTKTNVTMAWGGSAGCDSTTIDITSSAQKTPGGIIFPMPQPHALQLNAMHYQGGAKGALPYDMCRYLLLSGSKTISMPSNVVACKAEFAAHPDMKCSAVDRHCPAEMTRHKAFDNCL